MKDIFKKEKPKLKCPLCERQGFETYWVHFLRDSKMRREEITCLYGHTFDWAKLLKEANYDADV